MRTGRAEPHNAAGHRAPAHLSIVALLGGQLGFTTSCCGRDRRRRCDDATPRRRRAAAARWTVRCRCISPVATASSSAAVAGQRRGGRSGESERHDAESCPPERAATPRRVLLLDKGADVDQSRNGVTLLFLACRGHVDAAALLLERRGGRPGAGERTTPLASPARARRSTSTRRVVVRKGRGGRDGRRRTDADCPAITAHDRPSRRCARSTRARSESRASYVSSRTSSALSAFGPCVEREWTKRNRSLPSA